jgi:hypothetical protein
MCVKLGCSGIGEAILKFFEIGDMGGLTPDVSSSSLGVARSRR